jgi:hypothetical protein
MDFRNIQQLTCEQYIPAEYKDITMQANVTFKMVLVMSAYMHLFFYFCICI